MSQPDGYIDKDLPIVENPTPFPAPEPSSKDKYAPDVEDEIVLESVKDEKTNGTTSPDSQQLQVVVLRKVLLSQRV